jgi:hypothetical protein
MKVDSGILVSTHNLVQEWASRGHLLPTTSLPQSIKGLLGIASSQQRFMIRLWGFDDMCCLREIHFCCNTQKGPIGVRMIRRQYNYRGWIAAERLVGECVNESIFHRQREWRLE